MINASNDFWEMLLEEVATHSSIQYVTSHDLCYPIWIDKRIRPSLAITGDYIGTDGNFYAHLCRLRCGDGPDLSGDAHNWFGSTQAILKGSIYNDQDIQDAINTIYSLCRSGGSMA